METNKSTNDCNGLKKNTVTDVDEFITEEVGKRSNTCKQNHSLIYRLFGRLLEEPEPLFRDGLLVSC